VKRKSTIRKTRAYVALPPEQVRDLMRALNQAEQALKKIESILDTELGLSQTRKRNVLREVDGE